MKILTKEKYDSALAKADALGLYPIDVTTMECPFYDEGNITPVLGTFISGFENLDKAIQFVEECGGELYTASWCPGWGAAHLGTLIKRYPGEGFGSTFDDDEVDYYIIFATEPQFNDYLNNTGASEELIEEFKDLDWSQFCVSIRGNVFKRINKTTTMDNDDEYDNHYATGVFLSNQFDEEDVYLIQD